ncbi:MAG: hypothetical protein H0V44_10820 [Planctomycetes bacterium]|nr:hypothetical protein [Planctomycetota bacterium]
MKPSYRILLLAAAVAFCATGCGENNDKGVGERSGEAVDKAAHDTGEAVEKAADKTGDAVQEGADKVEDAAK